MIKSQVADGKGRGSQAYVEDNALLVTQYTCPPMLPQKNIIFRKYLTDDGTTSGSEDMGIDGSGTAVKFYIEADSDNDIYISAVNFSVGYGSAGNLFEFADSATVPGGNGFRFYYERENNEIDIHSAIKTNSDLLRVCVRDLLHNWEQRHFAALNDYGYMCTVNLGAMMPPYGVKLDAGSDQKLIFEVRDDNTDADVMSAIVYGFERFE